MSFRRPLFAAAILACALLAPGPAHAAPVPRPPLASYPETITSAHFQIHYTGAASASDRVIDQKAADVDEIAEQAYTALTQTYGYPAPMDDGDGKVDLWIASTGSADVLGLAFPDDDAIDPTSGWMLIDSADGTTPHVIAHELFHLIQFGRWASADGWLLESTAEWMGFRFEGFPEIPVSLLGAPDMSLDCVGDKCADDDYERGGYSRWTFFEYLNEHFGSTIVEDILDDGLSTGGPAITSVSNALAAKGTTLSNVFTDWTVANMYGNYTAPGLQNVLPPPYNPVATGAKTATLPTQHLAVNHLAARYLGFKRGDGSDSACYKAKLNVTVTIPSGIAARPYFYWPALGATPVPLTIVGNTATLAGQDWDTCAWPYAGYLVLQNPSLTSDAADFKVDASIVVDKTQPASATVQPPPVTVWGPVVPAPATDPAPTLSVHAPEVLRVSSKTRLLRFVVYSNGPGKLQATLGSASLGTKTLRTGNNDVRFVLPKTVFSSLRSTKGANVLSLTSLSPQGTAGATFTRHIAIQKPAKKKPKKH
jgi:hypothetical protein